MESSFLKTNVTCVKFVEKYLLAGISGELNVFCETPSTLEWKLVTVIKIFPPQNIYGIIPNDCKMVLVYGGRKIALLDLQLQPFKLQIVKKLQIHDWILEAVWLHNELEIAVLTANNVLHRYSLYSGNELCKLKSEEMCILYSGKILYNVWKELVVLAGTVFQEIIIWACSNNNDAKPVLHRLKGHKGVIFSVNYDSQSNLIYSTSDDRTVRVWAVQFPNSGEKIKWQKCNIYLKVSIFSHLARVWKSQIISTNKFATIGEDSLISIWDEKGDCINKWNGHQGGAVWSVDYSKEFQLIATGGSDGAINFWPTCDHTTFQLIYEKNSSTKCIPRTVALTNGGNIILMDSEGKLSYYRDNNWICSYEDKKFANYCLLKVSPSRRFIAMGNIDGFATILRDENCNILKVWDGQLLEGRIFSFIWLTEIFMITCGSNGNLIVWEFENFKEPNLKMSREFSLPKCKERWITCALLVGDYLLCGDRSGSLHLYDYKDCQKEPLHTIRKLHGYKGVTSIKIINDRIISTGRDGTYKRLEIHDKFIKVLDTNKSQMEWISFIEETIKFGPIIVGFHDVHLIIWNYQECRSLLEIDCGGGHRSWDLFIDNSLNNLTIVFIKDKGVYSYCKPINLMCLKSPLVGYHSKSINAACLLFNERMGLSDYILTGGEDNTLRAFTWDGDSYNVQITLNRHISSIRALHCIKDINRNCYFVASSGGRGQLIMWQVLESEGKIKMLEAASHMVRDENYSLTSSKQNEPLPDPETRYMDVNIVKLSETSFIILAGCSDGLFRILTFNATANRISVLKACYFHEHCILKIAHFIWNDIFAITMTTDGKLTFWNVNLLLNENTANLCKPKVFTVHDLGVNSYGLVLKNDVLILATGSDDASIAVTVFKLDKDNQHNAVSSWIDKNLHTCQITGIEILGDTILSVALDQKISIIKWSFNQGSFNARLISQIKTSVPDVHGLLVWLKPENTMNVCVYGLGIELFKQTIDNKPEDNIY